MAREFEEEVNTICIIKNEYEILLKDYKGSINTDLIDELKSKAPYGVDNFYCRNLEKKALAFMKTGVNMSGIVLCNRVKKHQKKRSLSLLLSF